MKTRNLMAAFAFALCLGLGAYENFDAAYKDAQRLEKVAMVKESRCKL